MKTLKIEPFSGISGDMMLGALVDLGAPGEMLKELPRILGFSDVDISITTVQKCGISCTKVNILDKTQPVARHLHHILAMIEQAELPAKTKSLASRIFTLLGEAEAKVHGVSIEKVHFHEVGAVDSIMDIVGVALLLGELEFSRVVASPVCIGSGFVHCDHGKFPVPAPATELLLQGLPTFPGDTAKEMTTPTGAAILKALEPDFTVPVLNMTASGYGAGDRDLEQPNCLRLGLGEPVGADHSDEEQICVIQSNLDDISGELLGGHFQDLLLANGALDLNLSALVMKKGRPGHRLEVLCLEADLKKLADLILKETTTIGVRHWRANRIVLARTWETVETRFGKIRLKCVSLPDGGVRKTPEYEDCRLMAISAGATVQEVMREALRLSE
jgi:pyridinium-3,5-bisthiocarboxylic acid mononucleotide nickel chelatase